jgi:hypothetical protein
MFDLEFSHRHLDKDTADCPQFKPLVAKTAEHFTVKEVAADKAYLSNENLEQVADLGGTPFIPFKINSTSGEPGSLWEKLFHFYSLNKDEYMARYHRRSNVESVFSMVKAKFRDFVRSKTDTAMRNEVLCKFIAHNVCCLIMSQLELGIDVLFWGDAQAERAEAAPAPTVAPAAPVAPVAPARQDAERPAPRFMPFAGA